MYPWENTWKIESIVNFPPYTRDKNFIDHAAVVSNGKIYKLFLFDSYTGDSAVSVAVTEKIGKSIVRSVYDAQTSGQFGYIRNLLQNIHTFERDSNGAVCSAQTYDEWRFRSPV